MARRYSFFILFFTVLAPLAWWSDQVRVVEVASGSLASEPSEYDASRRLDLVETLDRLVAYEHYYRSVYGHFTQRLSRLGYALPVELTDTYEIHVSEASRGRLVICATSEINGQILDRVSIDQSYVVRANFTLPEPRTEHLKALAFKQLRALRDAPAGAAQADLEERGVFSGYFQFETHQDLGGRKIASAVGIKPPVVGLRLELGTEDLEVADAAKTGQKPSGSVMSTLEEAYLAQRIFRGEMGRYAKSWSELSKIAAFRFEDKDQFGRESQVPFGEAGHVTEIDVTAPVGLRLPSSESQPLEIEPIFNSSN